MIIPLPPLRVVSQVKMYAQKPLLQLHKFSLLKRTMSPSSISLLWNYHRKCLILSNTAFMCPRSLPFNSLSLSKWHLCSLFTAPIDLPVTYTVVVLVSASWEQHIFVQFSVLSRSAQCLSWGKPQDAVVFIFSTPWHLPLTPAIILHGLVPGECHHWCWCCKWIHWTHSLSQDSLLSTQDKPIKWESEKVTVY